MYKFSFDAGVDGPEFAGKVVCVGRNYAAHAAELGNVVPDAPILFMKPSTSLVAMSEAIELPEGLGSCHVETEMALLIGEPLKNTSKEQCLSAVSAVAIAFDLTLRDVQNQLKKDGHPWERAKAFDGSCPISQWISCEDLDWTDVSVELERNGGIQQKGSTAQMIFPVANLLEEISHSFALSPGDVVLTGTPAGVCALESGDQLSAKLDGRLTVSTTVK